MPDKRIHFIGAGGCSMAGLASLMRGRGFCVTGSDREKSHKTDALNESGIHVSIGHAAENARGADLVVYTAAIPDDNPELCEARALGIPCMERLDFLSRLLGASERAICVSGTHGKTTTTSMLAQVFSEAGLDPTVHIGGELDALGGGTREGGQEYFICEACEFKRGFLKLNPDIAVIMNIDEDHLDCYRDIDDIESAFHTFAARVPSDGWCVGFGDDPRVRNVLEAAACKTRTFGLQPWNELRAEDVSYDERGRARFTATLFGHPLMDVELSVPGEHNLIDALAAICVADICELPMSSASETLARFSGAHRRFELTSVTDGAHVYQDYGHNPAEIKNALRIAKMQPHETLWAVWQPHTYSRTRTLWNGFLETFFDADRVLITDICAAREKDPGDLNSAMLIEPLREKGVRCDLTPTFDDAEAFLRANWKAGDLVVTLGCGDIYKLNDQIAEHGDTRE